VSGDFFVYPEESLEALEESLKECSSAKCVEEKFSEFAKKAEALGFDPINLGKRVAEIFSKLCKAQST